MTGFTRFTGFLCAAGNITQDLRHIEALSCESEWVYGGIRLPYILLPELNVVTRD